MSYDACPATLSNVDLVQSSGDSSWGAWTVGYGLAGQAAGDGNAHGVDYSSEGTLVALERVVDFDSRFGLFYGYDGAYAATQVVNQRPTSAPIRPACI